MEGHYIVTEEAQALEEYLKEEASDGDGKAAAQAVRYAASWLSYNHYCVLIRTAPINGHHQ